MADEAPWFIIPVYTSISPSLSQMVGIFRIPGEKYFGMIELHWGGRHGTKSVPRRWEGVRWHASTKSLTCTQDWKNLQGSRRQRKGIKYRKRPIYISRSQTQRDCTIRQAQALYTNGHASHRFSIISAEMAASGNTFCHSVSTNRNCWRNKGQLQLRTHDLNCRSEEVVGREGTRERRGQVKKWSHSHCLRQRGQEAMGAERKRKRSIEVVNKITSRHWS
jgi:hypothetical protein